VSAEDLLASSRGSRTDASGKSVSNKILLSIPDHEYRVIHPHLEYLSLPTRFILHEPSERVRFACFPNSGLISLLVATRDGKTVEAGLIGDEGVVGIATVVGLTRSPLREVALIPTDGFKVQAGVMLNILKSTPQLQTTLSCYAVLQGMQIAQIVACNRLHRIEQRLARWLLMAQDKANSCLVGMTHDFLATMLGTNRPTVSYAAAILQRQKSIKYMRGAVKVVNRKKLEASACECYWVIQQFDRELGFR
jgi:CRP-like cAMP-binding protein